MYVRHQPQKVVCDVRDLIREQAGADNAVADKYAIDRRELCQRSSFVAHCSAACLGTSGRVEIEQLRFAVSCGAAFHHRVLRTGGTANDLLRFAVEHFPD